MPCTPQVSGTRVIPLVWGSFSGLGGSGRAGVWEHGWRYCVSCCSVRPVCSGRQTWCQLVVLSVAQRPGRPSGLSEVGDRSQCHPASVSQCSRSLGLVAARRGSPGPLYVPTPLSRSRPFRIGFRGAYVPFRFGGLFSTSQGRSGLPRGERLSSSHWFPPSSLAGAGSFWAAVTSVTKILAPFGRVNLTFPGQK